MNTPKQTANLKKEILDIFDASKSDEYMSEANAKKIKSLQKILKLKKMHLILKNRWICNI